MTEKVLTIMDNNSVLLPDVTTLTITEQQEYQKQAETLLNQAKDAIKHADAPESLKNYSAVCKTAILLNAWLLYLEVTKINSIKQAIEKNTCLTLKEAWKPYNFTRKMWQNRKDLSYDVIKEITEESLDLLKNGNWTLDDLPTLYKANQRIHNQDNKQDVSDNIMVLKSTLEKIPLPENKRFNVVYADLSCHFDVGQMQNYIAEDSVGFFWLDDLNIQSSMNILQNLNFQIKEISFWDTGKKYNGTFTTRQCKPMVVAYKGRFPKPIDFKLDSVVHESINNDRKPVYYAERIDLMFPETAILEVHCADFKYVEQHYTIDDIEGAE